MTRSSPGGGLDAHESASLARLPEMNRKTHRWCRRSLAHQLVQRAKRDLVKLEVRRGLEDRDHPAATEEEGLE